MINISTDLTILQQELLYKKIEDKHVQDSEYAKKSEHEKSLKQAREDSDTKAEISNSELPDIDKNLAEEEILANKLASAVNIHDSLAEIRDEIYSIISDLENPDVEYSIDDLEKLNEASNAIIKNVLNVLDKNKAFNIVNQDYLNIYITGLNNLSNLQINDNDYLSKLNGILYNVKTEEKNFLNLSEILYADINKASNFYESKFKLNKNQEQESALQIQKAIIEKAKETIESSSAKISKETVLRILQG